MRLKVWSNEETLLRKHLANQMFLDNVSPFDHPGNIVAEAKNVSERVQKHFLFRQQNVLFRQIAFRQIGFSCKMSKHSIKEMLVYNVKTTLAKRTFSKFCVRCDHNYHDALRKRLLPLRSS